MSDDRVAAADSSDLTEAARPALTSRITGSLARRMIEIATRWISVLLIGGSLRAVGA